ncbi:hypothetical protein JCM12294_16390 [Desulfocicer niacini]
MKGNGAFAYTAVTGNNNLVTFCYETINNEFLSHRFLADIKTACERYHKPSGFRGRGLLVNCRLLLAHVLPLIELINGDDITLHRVLYRVLFAHRPYRCIKITAILIMNNQIKGIPPGTPVWCWLAYLGITVMVG